MFFIHDFFYTCTMYSDSVPETTMYPEVYVPIKKDVTVFCFKITSLEY